MLVRMPALFHQNYGKTNSVKFTTPPSLFVSLAVMDLCPDSRGTAQN